MRAVLYFRELLFKSNKKKFSFRRVESDMNVIAARFRKCSDLDREGKVLIKNKTNVASGVGFSESSPVF